MAMLAERRERKRYNLVPRGKALYEDDNRFGTRMLEKMGWSKGKGLGANENGAREFVRIRYKNDSVGLGFEDRNDQWTQHEESFDGLLKTLNFGGGDDTVNSKLLEEEGAPVARGFGYPKEDVSEAPKICISGESLEEKSKRSRARVHYMKFTRGKDISRYSEKDLANIFGKKSLVAEEKPNLPKEDDHSSSVQNQKTSDNEEEQNFKFGVPTICSGTSINDYFKAKLEAIRNKSKGVSTSNGVEKIDSQQLKDKKVEDEGNFEEQTSKKKKKKRKAEVEDENVLVDGGLEETLITGRETEIPVKKKKKSKPDMVNEVENLEVLEENNDQSNEEIAKAFTEKKKKSKRKEHEHDKEVHNEDEIQHNENDLSRSSSQKSKRKSVVLDTLIETQLGYPNQVLPDEVDSETFSKSPKKLKSDAGTIMNDDSNMCNEDVAQKKKKKKSKKSDESEKEMTEVKESPEEMNSTKDVCKEVKKSKKKSTHAERSESENSKPLEIVEATGNDEFKKPKKSKLNGENEASENIDIDPITAPPKSDAESQQVSTSESTATKIIDNNFRFPELTRKKKKKESTKIEISLKSDQKDEQEFQYKMSGYAAEKFYNVNIEGFPGSNFEDIIGYGLSGRVKVEIIRSETDILKIKNFYQKELAAIRASKRKDEGKKVLFGKKVKQREKTLFPKLL